MPTTQSAITDSVPMTLHSVGTLHERRSMQKFADTALKAAAGFWFVVTVIGQLLFAFSIALFYGLTAARGDWFAWNRTMTHGYVPGYHVGNTVVAIHLASAVIIILSGAIQLIPRIRQRAPYFHRWNGRIYMVSAFSVSLAGLYMMWFRGTVGGVVQHLAQSLDAVLIMLCAVMALRYALARDFKTHRRWALRLYLVVSASLFIRAAGIILQWVPATGPFGFDPVTFQGPFLAYLSFAQYVVPLAVLELYLRTQARPGTARRIAMAATLFVLTIALGAGISAASVTAFLPRIKAAFDGRKSIAEALSATIASSSVDAAAQQYHHLNAAEPATYNFEENELNTLGYDLLRSRKFDQAIRIFQLNVEAYPQSGNVYDSLAEAYMDDGNKSQAITDYRESLQKNPKNRNAVQMLQKLNAP
jgi:tetratricopeptide (TPR) repeat protein